MNISVSKVKDAHIPLVADAGFFGVDEGFPSLDSRDDILSGVYAARVHARYDIVRRHGLAVCQTHLTYQPSHLPPIGDGSYEAYEACLLPVLEKEIAFTAEMGCRVAVMHPYYEENVEKSREGNLRLFEKLLPTLERYGVVYALENIYGARMSDAHHSCAEDMLYYTDRVDSPHLGLCLDTGHALIRGQQPDEFLEKIVHRLAGLHLHTTIPSGDFHSMPFMLESRDRIKWERIGKLLANSDYAGTFNMEIRPPVNLSDAAAALYYQLAHQIAEDILTAEN